MQKKYNEQVDPIKAYNRKKMENWEKIQRDQYTIDMQEKLAEVNLLIEQAKASTNYLEKIDIKKQAEAKLKTVQDMQSKFHEKEAKIHEQAEQSVEEFDKQFDINPILLIKIVLRF